MLRNTVRQFAGVLSPRKLFYESQKVRVRMVRLLEALEGLVGARPGGRLQVHFRGTERLESTVEQASRRLALALGLTAALIGAAVTATSSEVPHWVPQSMGGLGALLAAGLFRDLLRRRA